jgi:hypothetical protein
MDDFSGERVSTIAQGLHAWRSTTCSVQRTLNIVLESDAMNAL